MSGFQTIRYEIVQAGVLRLTLNRPAKHNALNSVMIRELTDVAQRVASDPTLRAVVLAAEGQSFCAGGDLGWMKTQFDATSDQRAREAEGLFRMLSALDEIPQLVIAAMQGPAYGGGVGLAAVCDVVIASAEVRFALSETQLGLIPATIVPFLLRSIGSSALRRIGLHGVTVDAKEAREIGLVSEVVEEGAMEGAIERHVQWVLACAPGALAAAKALFRAAARGEAGEREVIEALVARWQSPEAQAGVAAFFAKEKPPWQTT